jgi:hypothetical protein
MRGYLGNQARNRQKGGHRNRGGAVLGTETRVCRSMTT